MSRTVAILAALAAATVFAAAVAVVANLAPAKATFPGANGKIAYAVYNENTGRDYEIYTIWSDGGGRRPLTDNRKYDIQPAYSPNGNRIAYSGWDSTDDDQIDFQIYTMRAGGGDRRQVTHLSKRDASYPYYSPSGKRIAYSSWDGNDSEIYTIDVGGGDKRQVTHNSTGDYDPAYGPGGRRIAFECLKEGASRPPIGNRHSEICTIKVGGGDRRQLTHNSTRDMYPDYAPDGNRIAYTHDYQIYTMRTDGEGKRPVTFGVYPSYSPSGNRIAYSDGDGNDYEIYTIKPDGDGKHRVTDNSVPADKEPSWGSR